MSKIRVYISNIGIISSIGKGITATLNAIRENRLAIKPITLFKPPANKIFPAGQINEIELDESNLLPRTHILAQIAAKEAMNGCDLPPDAIVIGTTTGGMSYTELKLKKGDKFPQSYKYHSPFSVAEYIANLYSCKGPVITISTACSSGAAAIAIASEMIRKNLAKRVLAGGVDSLCKLTYYGFSSLQLIDPDCAKPFDLNRKGMNVAEGAAMMLLSADEPVNAIAEVLGIGLSCDAYHPTSPHPQGNGAKIAMQNAISDAAVSIDDIDYINLHGTGTVDNDLSEVQAINSLFTSQKPMLSSIKGALGHSLGASGAIEALISALAISEKIVPGNAGYKDFDHRLQLEPLIKSHEKKIKCILSNSFGFGGNNASLIITEPKQFEVVSKNKKTKKFKILGSSYITGTLDMEEISSKLPQNIIRRLKKLPRLALYLAIEAYKNSKVNLTPSAIFVGTGWGALSETYDFLMRLFQSNEQYPSPIDFVGSVHNSPAGQIAIYFKSEGANITATGENYSFEQALMSASLLSKDDECVLALGVDEFHKELSNLFDESTIGETASEGGGAFILKKNDDKAKFGIELSFYENANNNLNCIESLIDALGGIEKIKSKYGFIMAGIPKANLCDGNLQLKKILSLSDLSCPVINYRKFSGEFASASAAASVMAFKILENGKIPYEISGTNDLHLDKKAGLVLGLGKFITAIDIFK